MLLTTNRCIQFLQADDAARLTPPSLHPEVGLRPTLAKSPVKDAPAAQHSASACAHAGTGHHSACMCIALGQLVFAPLSGTCQRLTTAACIDCIQACWSHKSTQQMCVLTGPRLAQQPPSHTSAGTDTDMGRPLRSSIRFAGPAGQLATFSNGNAEGLQGADTGKWTPGHGRHTSVS